jgi:hypothetical protein
MLQIIRIMIIIPLINYPNMRFVFIQFLDQMLNNYLPKKKVLFLILFLEKRFQFLRIYYLNFKNVIAFYFLLDLFYLIIQITSHILILNFLLLHL